MFAHFARIFFKKNVYSLRNFLDLLSILIGLCLKISSYSFTAWMREIVTEIRFLFAFLSKVHRNLDQERQEWEFEAIARCHSERFPHP